MKKTAYAALLLIGFASAPCICRNPPRRPL